MLYRAGPQPSPREKIAEKFEKPDGLSWLSPSNMPDRIADMPLDKLPGIAKGVRRKL